MARTTRSPRLQTLFRTLRVAVTTAGRPLRAAATGGRLQGRTLVLARIAWLALAALTFALYVAGVWVHIGRLRGPCPPSLCIHGQVPPAVQRAFAALHLSVSFHDWYTLWLNVVFAVGFAAVAALLFWRRSHDPLALFASSALLLFGVAAFEGGFLAAGLPSVSPGWRLPVALLGFVGEMAFGLFVIVFPDGRFVPRWTPLVSVAFVLWWLPLYVFPGSPLDFNTWPGLAYFAGWAVILGLMGGAQVYRYRYVSTPKQRLQTKWVVFGFVAAGIGYLAGWLVFHLLRAPVLTSPTAVLADLAGITLIFGSLLLIPICIGIAMLRYHLFDIDVLIRRTLIYSLITGLLATVYAITGIVLQAAFVAMTGQASALAVVGSTLAIAALFQPVRSRVQAAVDRRFYRRKYDAARTLQAFGATVRDEVDLAQLSDQVVMVVEETMQPSQVSLWLVRPDQPVRSGEPPAGQRPSYAAEVEAAHVPKPVPLPGLFAVPDGPQR